LQAKNLMDEMKQKVRHALPSREGFIRKPMGFLTGLEMFETTRKKCQHEMHFHQAQMGISSTETSFDAKWGLNGRT